MCQLAGLALSGVSSIGRNYYCSKIEHHRLFSKYMYGEVGSPSLRPMVIIFESSLTWGQSIYEKKTQNKRVTDLF